MPRAPSSDAVALDLETIPWNLSRCICAMFARCRSRVNSKAHRSTGLATGALAVGRWEGFQLQQRTPSTLRTQVTLNMELRWKWKIAFWKSILLYKQGGWGTSMIVLGELFLPSTEVVFHVHRGCVTSDQQTL